MKKIDEFSYNIPNDLDDDVWIETDLDEFHIGPYKDEAAKTIKCVICGSIEFHVAKGEYYTAVRCTACRWEIAIHSG